MRNIVRGAAAAMATTMTLSLAACGGSKSNGDPLSSSSPGGGGKGTVVVGSANYPENVLLGEIYYQALKAKGVKVAKKLNINAREVIYKSIQSGELSVLPEYNGALLSFIDKSANAVTTDQVNTALKQKLPASLELLQSAQAEDKDSVTVTKTTADKYKLKSIADLKPVAGQLTIGGPPEFKTRAQGLIGLGKVYGLTFKGFKSLDVAGPVTVSALAKNQVQAADLFTTDPAIVKNGFVVLQDPKNLYSAQNVTPLVNKAVANPDVTSTLDAVAAKLTTQDLLDMNKQVSVDKKDAEEVAADWLKKAGLGG
ncbi:ABC transporter substrate-binding protein [Actinoallomurus purpureus]|uniref:ABC transporter substrate-binding protein n=1 Tax=Actinoallomurus purpureus TaxID=478114 RepID=UPI0020922F9B|nr:ABC transporter substrate-binding protein [Actinoallomurus purpureus]MCO6007597.1 ABC transporter substrate-binding protein [Actinoallomurus purpureus]